MYASLWEAYRKEWMMSSGGPGSALYKSTDGGETWTDITHVGGLPMGIDGKIGISISRADPNRVFALIENENGGLFRTDDAGATWTLVNNERRFRQRAFYYTHVFADTKNKDLVYVENVGTYRSRDGGKTFAQQQFARGDSHDLWIDPDDDNHVLHAADRAATSRSTRRRTPPRGARSTIRRPVLSHRGDAARAVLTCADRSRMRASCACRRRRRSAVAAAVAAAGAAADRRNSARRIGRRLHRARSARPDIFYSGTNANGGGFLTKLNRRTGEVREVSPYPRMFSGEESAVIKERWQWTYPIVFSPVDPKALYTGSQHLWKTTNGGDSWERISPTSRVTIPRRWVRRADRSRAT